MNTAIKLHDEQHQEWVDAFTQSTRQHKVLLNKLVTKNQIEEDGSVAEDDGD